MCRILTENEYDEIEFNVFEFTSFLFEKLYGNEAHINLKVTL